MRWQRSLMKEPPVAKSTLPAASQGRPNEARRRFGTPITRYTPDTSRLQLRRDAQHNADADLPVVVDGSVVCSVTQRLLADYDIWSRWADIQLIERAHGSYSVIMAAVVAGLPQQRPLTKGPAGRAAARADAASAAAWTAGLVRLGELDEWVRLCQQQHASLASHFEKCLEYYHEAVLQRLDDEGVRLNLAALWHRPDLKVRADAAALPTDLQRAVDQLRSLINGAGVLPPAQP